MGEERKAEPKDLILDFLSALARDILSADANILENNCNDASKDIQRALGRISTLSEIIKF